MKQNFLKGAVIVAVGGIAAKILGAFYRIPLTNILGGEGMGVYQMVYPLYCLLLTVSATGIPSGLARIVSAAESRGDASKSRAVLKKSLLLFSGIGLCGSALMFLLAPALSAAQGETAAISAYRALAPGVFFVSVLSCFRGWFQGKSNFLPTAFSEICEQAVKVALGLFFARTFRSEPLRAVVWTLASVSLSELAACLTGRGKPKIAAFAMTAAVLFKLIAELILLRFEQISVLGAAYAAIGCYFVALAVDLLYSIREAKNRIAALGWFLKFSAMSVLSVLCALAAARVHVLLALGAAALVYLALSVLLRAFSVQELQFSGRKHHAHHRRAGLQP